MSDLDERAKSYPLIRVGRSSARDIFIFSIGPFGSEEETITISREQAQDLYQKLGNLLRL